MCEEIATTTTSTLPAEPSFEVHNRSTSVNDVCTDDKTHDVVDHEVSIADTTLYHSADFD